MNQSLILATHSERIKSKGGFGGQVELGVIPNEVNDKGPKTEP